MEIRLCKPARRAGAGAWLSLAIFLAEQNAYIMEEFESLKKDTKGAFEQLDSVNADVFEIEIKSK